MLASLIAAVASGELFGAIRRAKGAAIAYLLAGVFALAGAGFIVVGLFILAARRWGPVQAAMGFGGLFLLIAVLIIVIHALSRRWRAKQAARQRGADFATIAGAAAVSLLPILMRSKIGMGGLVGPLLAVAAYVIYRENVGPKKPGPDEPPL